MKKAFGGITSTSLETKAAILGVIYGLGRLTADTTAVGTALVQFNNLTGLSGDRLQRWQYLARQSGESAEQMTADITNLQAAIAKIYLTGDKPAGLNALANTLGRDFDPSRMRDPYYMMDKLREAAVKLRGNADIRNQVLKTFGLSDATVGAMATSKVNLDKVPRGYLYGPETQKGLMRTQVELGNVADKFEKGMGRLVAKFGPTAAKDIGVFADAVLKLVNALAVLAEKAQALKLLTDLVTSISDAVNFGSKAVKKVSDLPMFQQKEDLFKAIGLGGARVPTITYGAKTMVNSLTVNAPISGVTDPEEVGKHLARACNDAFRNISRGGQ